VIVPWTGYQLFTHQIDPVSGTIIFIVAFGLLIWLIRTLKTSRHMSKKPGFRLVFFSILAIAVICAFAGIEPLTSYKNISLDFIKQKTSNISESFAKITPPVTTESQPTGVAAITAKIKPSVVYIHTDVGNSSYIGSGMVIDKSGYVLTNNHVIQDSKLPTVTLATGMECPCSIVKRDDIRDLAILKIAVSGMDLKAVTFGNSDELESGDEVIAVGYPLGLEGGATVTKGIVSALRLSEGVHYIQTDAAVNPGNSGAPLINMRGEVVGLITFKIVLEKVEGMGFAIAINDVKPFINGQIENTKAPYQYETQNQENSLVALEQETLSLINVERQTRSIRPVLWSELLHNGAREHSDNMQEKGYLYHETYGQFAECCYGASYTSMPYSSAKATVDAWMASTAGHREILLDSQYTIGAVGVARDKGFWATYRCQ
jgi:S1-C subfamily serine protease